MIARAAAAGGRMSLDGSRGLFYCEDSALTAFVLGGGRDL